MVVYQSARLLTLGEPQAVSAWQPAGEATGSRPTWLGSPTLDPPPQAGRLPRGGPVLTVTTASFQGALGCVLSQHPGSRRRKPWAALREDPSVFAFTPAPQSGDPERALSSRPWHADSRPALCACRRGKVTISFLHVDGTAGRHPGPRAPGSSGRGRSLSARIVAAVSWPQPKQRRGQGSACCPPPHPRPWRSRLHLPAKSPGACTQRSRGSLLFVSLTLLGSVPAYVSTYTAARTGKALERNGS